MITVARATSQATMIRRRSHRSATAPASNPNSTYGTARTAESSPAWAGEPVNANISSG